MRTHTERQAQEAAAAHLAAHVHGTPSAFQEHATATATIQARLLTYADVR
jgi:hypothetical protein